MSKENMELLSEENTGKKKSGKKSGKKKTGLIIAIIVIAVVVLIAIVGSVISNISAGMQEAMQQMAGGGESTFEVEKQDIEQEITTSGTVIGTERDAYTSPVTAKVEDIKVEVGQTVKKGDVLLTYDASELGDNLAMVKIQAQSERAAGNESYEMAQEAANKVSAARNRVQVLQGEIGILQAQSASLTTVIEAYEKRIQAAEEGQKSEDEDDSDKKKAAKPLTKKEQKEYETAVAQLQQVNEQLAAKQEELAEQEAIIAANEDVKVSNSTKAQISANNQLSDMQINNAQESLDAAQAGIVAKRSGIVESIDVIKGSYANETQTLITILDSDQIGVEFMISKDDLDSIFKGQKARVVIAGNEYNGTVDFVSRVASVDAMSSAAGNGTAGIKGRIVLQNPDENIYIGVTAKVYIFVGKSEQALVVPYESLNTDINGDFVYVVNGDNKIERRDVKIGIYSDAYYEVLEGVKEGDKVITKVTAGMKPGDEYIDGGIMAQ